jgi:hypothetical protein
MIELLEHLLAEQEEDFEDLFQPVSDEEARKRVEHLWAEIDEHTRNAIILFLRDIWDKGVKPDYRRSCYTKSGYQTYSLTREQVIILVRTEVGFSIAEYEDKHYWKTKHSVGMAGWRDLKHQDVLGNKILNLAFPNETYMVW